MGKLIEKLVHKLSSETIVGEKRNFEEKGVFSPEDIMSLNIDSGSTAIEIRPTEKDEIVVLYHGEGNEKGLNMSQFYSKVVQNTLHVKVEMNSNFGMGVSYLDDQLTIELPSKLYHEIKVRCSSGKTNVHDLNVNILNVDASSGKVKANNLIAKQAIFRASSGKISAQNIKSDEAMFHTSSGKMEIDTIKSTTVEMKASSGRIKATHVFASQSTLRASSGKIEVTDILGHIDTETSSGKTSIHLQEITHNVSIKSSSGTVDLKVEKEPTSMELKFKSSSGPAHIKFPLEYKTNKHNDVHGHIGDGECKVNVRTTSGPFNFDFH
jgi:lia operon protein LiaG